MRGAWGGFVCPPPTKENWKKKKKLIWKRFFWRKKKNFEYFLNEEKNRKKFLLEGNLNLYIHPHCQFTTYKMLFDIQFFNRSACASKKWREWIKNFALPSSIPCGLHWPPHVVAPRWYATDNQIDVNGLISWFSPVSYFIVIFSPPMFSFRFLWTCMPCCSSTFWIMPLDITQILHCWVGNILTMVIFVRESALVAGNHGLCVTANYVWQAKDEFRSVIGRLGPSVFICQIFFVQRIFSTCGYLT